ncbi:MAG TPA: hypothetical protein VJ023_21775 [Pyrinomonadaceae bacterium]|nr:hypothetical protein [Pyrinomonadaceae bacterium]
MSLPPPIVTGHIASIVKCTHEGTVTKDKVVLAVVVRVGGPVIDNNKRFVAAVRIKVNVFDAR